MTNRRKKEVELAVMHRGGRQLHFSTQINRIASVTAGAAQLAGDVELTDPGADWKPGLAEIHVGAP